MPVDLGNALAGWVVSLVGEAAIRLLRPSPDQRDLSRAMGLAIGRVVEQADSSYREALRLGLQECFAAPPRLELDASTSVGEGLRAAIAAQVAQLDQMVHSDTGQPFYQAVPVKRAWLVEHVTAAVEAALRQVVAASGLAELVRGMDAADVLEALQRARIDTTPPQFTSTMERGKNVRRRISDIDRKLLWGRSGNECAFPSCAQVLTLTPTSEIHPRAVILGEEAHIVADRDNGPRGDPSMSLNERNSYGNLILLCPTHHTLIDKDQGIHFSAEDLQEIKRTHEARMIQRGGLNEDNERSFARRRLEALLERASACRGRLIARWGSVGISDSMAQELADDLSLGCPDEVRAKLAEGGLVVLEGDFGSGKSVVAERWHGEALAVALEDEHAAIPIYLEALAVKDSLMSAVREKVEGLGDPRSAGIRLVLDGLDESGFARAERLLYEARALRHTWPSCQILATARPGLTLGSDERITQPSMDEQEATALIERVGGHRSILLDESAAIRDTLRLPLFALIAAMHWKAPAVVPRSRGAFIEALANSALSRTQRPAGVARRGLMRLASLATSSNGAVSAAEVGDEEIVRATLETRLVVRKVNTLAFSLSVVEQYFAGQAILDTGLGQVDFDDLYALDRWRYPVVLAITAGAWEGVNALLRTLVSANPGLVAWIVANAVPDSGDVPLTEPPRDLECARRLHQTLSAWIDALGEVGQNLGLTNNDGRVRTVAVSVHNKRITAALGLKDATGPDAVRLPHGFNPFTGQAADGSRWGPCRGSHAPADFAAWPWRWSLDWASGRLEALLASKALPLSEESPMQAERRWALARVLLAQSSIIHGPLELSRVRESAERLMSNTPESLFRFRAGISATRGELSALVDWISSGPSTSPDGLLRRPYPVPDADPRGVDNIAKLYTDGTLGALVERVYTNALVIYSELVDMWFPKLKNTLGLACLLPVFIKGSLVLSEGTGWDAEPSFLFQTIPLPPEEASKVEVQLVGQRENIGVDWETAKSQWREIWRLVSVYRPGTEGWAKPYEIETALSVYKDMPATVQAYQWLWDDLHTLRLVRNKNCPVRDD